MHLSKLPSGTWRVAVKVGGQRRTATARTKGDAKRGWAGAVALVAAAALALFAVLFMDPAGSPPAGPLPEAAEINFAAPVTVEAEEPVGESVRWVWANRAALCREAEDVGRRQVVRVLLDVGRVESDVEVAYVRGVLAGCAAAP